MRISDWSSDVCSSDLRNGGVRRLVAQRFPQARDAVALRGGAEQHRHDEIVGEILAELLVDLGGGRHLVLEQLLEQPIVEVGEGFQKLAARRSEEHTSELQSLMRISYAVFCLKKKKQRQHKTKKHINI